MTKPTRLLPIAVVLFTFQLAVPDDAMARKKKTCEPPSGQEWRCNPPRHFGLGLALVKEYGFGAVFRGRINHVAFDAAVGYQPYFVTGDVFRYASTVQVTGAFLVFFSKVWSRFQAGLKAAYAWNSLSGHGFLFGFNGEFSIRKHFALDLGAGIQAFPMANQLVREKLDLQGVAFNAVVQPYIGLNLVWYLV